MIEKLKEGKDEDLDAVVVVVVVVVNPIHGNANGDIGDYPPSSMDRVVAERDLGSSGKEADRRSHREGEIGA